MVCWCLFVTVWLTCIPVWYVNVFVTEVWWTCIPVWCVGVYLLSFDGPVFQCGVLVSYLLRFAALQHYSVITSPEPTTGASG